MNKVERRRAWKKWAVRLKGGRCAMCLNAGLPQYCYEMHHIVKGTSFSDITRQRKFVFDWEYESSADNLRQDESFLRKELNKTVMLCTNCHKQAHNG